MLHFIINMQSGKGRGRKVWKRIARYLHRKRIGYCLYVTGKAKDATAYAASIHDGTIVAIGGDGTFHDVINGADFAKVDLGLIPAGRGNDFARGTGIPLDPIKALKCVLYGRRTPIDYIDVSGVKCLNVAGTGLDVAVLERVYAGKSKSYLSSLVYNLKHFTPYRLTVTADGITNVYDAIMVGACNGTQIGGGIRLSPASVADDGKLNAVIMTMPQSGGLTKALLKFKAGKHLNEPYTTHLLCEELSALSDEHFPVQLDGEIYYDLPLVCRVVKGGIRLWR